MAGYQFIRPGKVFYFLSKKNKDGFLLVLRRFIEQKSLHKNTVWFNTISSKRYIGQITGSSFVLEPKIFFTNTPVLRISGQVTKETNNGLIIGVVLTLPTELKTFLILLPIVVISFITVYSFIGQVDGALIYIASLLFLLVFMLILLSFIVSANLFLSRFTSYFEARVINKEI